MRNREPYEYPTARRVTQQAPNLTVALYFASGVWIGLRWPENARAHPWLLAAATFVSLALFGWAFDRYAAPRIERAVRWAERKVRGDV